MKKLHDVCSVVGCARKHKARGYCQTHYMQWMRGSPLEEIRSRERDKPDCCTEENCTEPVKSKGLCKMHYQRLLRHGHTKRTDRTKAKKGCLIPSCENFLYAKSLCHSHYMKQRYWQKLGMGVFEYLKMYEDQGGVCKICKKPESWKDSLTGKTKDLSIDHCHKTNAIRGLLCNTCNRALGLFRDDANILKAAIQYLGLK